jgi:hypothetical protein
MSNSNWERAEIVVPESSWAAFRNTVLAAWNAEQDRLLARAGVLHALIMAEAGGRDDVDWRAVVAKVRTGHPATSGEDGYVIRRMFNAIVIPVAESNGRWIDTMGIRGAGGTPPEPTRELYPPADPASGPIRFDDATIELDEDARTLRWTVNANNHAVENARRHPVAQTMFLELARMTWDDASGGSVSGGDEYHGGREDGAGSIRMRYGRMERMAV